MSERVIYLVRSWPRLSQTFIVNEVLALERRGVQLTIFSLVRSEEDIVQPLVDSVRAPVHYLEDHVLRPWRERLRAHLRAFAGSPMRYARTLLFCLGHPQLAAGYGNCSTLRSFSHAVHVTASVDHMRSAGEEAVHLHAHFAHDPALVGMLVARLTALPFSFTGHARDLLQIPAKSLAARAARATVLVTCCEANRDYICGVVPRSELPPVLVVHHGVELDRLQPAQRPLTVSVPTIMSVGRLVEKKGYDDLLHALAILKDAGFQFGCCIYGDGPLRQDLERLRDSLGLQNTVELMGARSSEHICTALASADLFVLTPREARDGDRDGIPNVLVEAMACGLPVVSTSVGGVPELAHHGVNGLIVEPGDVTAVAASVGRLINDPVLRRRLGAEARRTVESNHDVNMAARRLEAVFRPSVISGLGASR